MLRKSIRMATFALMASATLPLAANAATEGVLVTRMSSSSWQVRLVSTTTPAQFAAYVESTNPITSIYKQRLEADDRATLSTPNQLDLRFSTTANSFDGVRLWTTASSSLCLRDAGSTGAKVYLGATLASAVEVALPLALQGEDPCHLAPPPGPYQTTRKFHPGHYTAMLRAQGTPGYMIDAVRPGVRGLMVRYSWRSLEPVQGSYNFSKIAYDLNWAQSYGLQLIVMIEDKTFSIDNPAPDYLANLAHRNAGGGYTMARWNSIVVDRYNALSTALGAQFDRHANFEGIAMQETALSLDQATLNANGYTPEKYRDAYINTIGHALTVMPTSRVFWYQNYLVGNQGYIGEIAKAVGPKGMVMAGPDVLPDRTELVTRSYPYFEQLKGRMHMGIQIEGICYNHEHTSPALTKYWTPKELADYAVTNLNANYLIWVRIPKSDPVDSYNWYDALPVIATTPTYNP